MKVCIVTGRTLTLAEPILAVLKINTPVILLGGCQIFDTKTKKFIYTKYLEKDDTAAIIKIITAYKKPFHILEPTKRITYNGSYEGKEALDIFLPDLTEKLADEIIDKLSHISTISTHKIISWTPGDFCLDISHASATKQHAIIEVAKMLKIETHEMIGVGEGPNDFPLLMACGLKVAMGNAVDDLKAIADYIAPSIDEDGVADVIEKFVLQ